ncbi:MAG: hypothetical protein GDA56_06880 [Hormoscilla sp. GM7CHS1pb]|nr:hypothetical protein [Hormoscilla sp. GM7CHS1pb]
MNSITGDGKVVIIMRSKGRSHDDNLRNPVFRKNRVSGLREWFATPGRSELNRQCF